VSKDQLLPTVSYIAGYDLYNSMPTPMLKVLSPREKLVLKGRFQQLKTLQQIGDELGVTRERVRQIQARAIAKVDDALSQADGSRPDDQQP
jgi:DNA-directed RNA polymerase sigma subunit (sigma70/sigma32)